MRYYFALENLFLHHKWLILLSFDGIYCILRSFSSKKEITKRCTLSTERHGTWHSNKHMIGWVKWNIDQCHISMQLTTDTHKHFFSNNAHFKKKNELVLGTVGSIALFSPVRSHFELIIKVPNFSERKFFIWGLYLRVPQMAFYSQWI